MEKGSDEGDGYPIDEPTDKAIYYSIFPLKIIVYSIVKRTLRFRLYFN
jgi:hypothetical protein